MALLCCHCQSELTTQGEALHCPQCGIGFRKVAYCPECRTPLQVLKACGAVDFFCQQHGLLSSSRVLWLAET